MPVRLEKDDDDNTSFSNSSDDSGGGSSSSGGGGLFSILGMIFRALFGWFFSRRG